MEFAAIGAGASVATGLALQNTNPDGSTNWGGVCKDLALSVLAGGVAVGVTYGAIEFAAVVLEGVTLASVGAAIAEGAAAGVAFVGGLAVGAQVAIAIAVGIVALGILAGIGYGLYLLFKPEVAPVPVFNQNVTNQAKGAVLTAQEDKTASALVLTATANELATKQGELIPLNQAKVDAETALAEFDTEIARTAGEAQTALEAFETADAAVKADTTGNATLAQKARDALAEKDRTAQAATDAVTAKAAAVANINQAIADADTAIADKEAEIGIVTARQERETVTDNANVQAIVDAQAALNALPPKPAVV